jgi:hypothetical protein
MAGVRRKIRTKKIDLIRIIALVHQSIFLNVNYGSTIKNLQVAGIPEAILPA